MIPTDEQIMIRDMARAFAAERIAPFAAEWEERAHFPRDVFAAMGKLGLMGMTIPTEWGGAGLDYVTYAIALEEIAAGDGAVAIVMSGHNSVGCMPVLEYGTRSQKDRYLRRLAQGELLSAFALTEAKGGSDAGALTARAARRLCHQRRQAVHYHGQERRSVPGLRRHRPRPGQTRHFRLCGAH